MRRLSLIDAIAQARLSIRSLGKARTFSLALLGTIILAVATGSAMTSLLNTVLLRPLPYPESERLVGLWHTAPGIGIPLLPQASGTYDLYRQARSLEAIGAYFDGNSPVSHGAPDAPTERLDVAGVTASIFPTLRARALIGRLFTDNDERPGTPKVTLISERYWRTRLNATPTVIGTHIRIDGIDREVVGVLPESFGFPGTNIDVWAPIIVDPEGYLGVFGIRAIARLRPGVTREAAQAELRQVLARAPEKFPEQRPGVPTGPTLVRAHLEPLVHSLRDDAIGGFERVLWLAAATVAVLLLVALSNISSLVLARSDARQRELAVRAVLGASTARVWWSFVTEVLVLAAMGGTIGLSLAAAALALLPHTGATQLVDPRVTDASRVVIPRLAEIHPDATLVWSGILLTLLCAAAGAAIGVGRLTTSDPARVLREGGRPGTAGAGSQRLRAAFVAIEVAVSLVLLSGSAMLGHSLLRLLSVDPGFRAGNKIVFSTTLRGTAYFDPAACARFYRDALERISRLPGVREAGIVSKLPLQNGPVLELVTVEDAPPQPGSVGLPSAIASASSGYFHAIGTPFLAGHTFEDRAVRAGLNEAVIGRAFAVHYWGDSTGVRALGRRIRPYAESPWYTIVGVVGDVRDTALTSPPSEVVYVPQELGDKGDILRARHDMSFVLQTDVAPAGLAAALRQQIRAVDPAIPVQDLETLTEHVATAGRRLRFVLLLLGSGAAMTLALGIVGLYGVIAYSVSRRSREIGIRIALGLVPSRATELIVRRGAWVVGTGIIAGGVAFVAFARLLRNLTYGVGAIDGASLATAVLIVAAVAALATYLPARRAAGINPVETLRGE